jgi:2-iminobutanoate/2-iminopropanoate deaminase
MLNGEKMNFVKTENAPQAIGPYSQAVAINGMLYTSGQIALKPNGEFLNESIEIQTEQVLENLKNVLIAGGSSLNSVVKTTIFLSDMNDFQKVNIIYENHFGDHRPARSTVAVKTLPKNALVEIEAIAEIN